LILGEGIQDNAENYTRFVLLVPVPREQSGAAWCSTSPAAKTDSMAELLVRRCAHPSQHLKMSLALRLAHKPGALLAALEPFARHGINLLKIESRPIHGSPWEYQFFLDVQTDALRQLEQALKELTAATSFLRILGAYAPALYESSV
jgi:prephenate dehydratase